MGGVKKCGEGVRKSVEVWGKGWQVCWGVGRSGGIEEICGGWGEVGEEAREMR